MQKQRITSMLCAVVLKNILSPSVKGKYIKLWGKERELTNYFNFHMMSESMS